MKIRGFLGAVALLMCPFFMAHGQEHTVAHQWNEQLLEAIRNDFARPTVHARNLYHASILMYDSWAAYDDSQAKTIFLGQTFDGYTCPFDASALAIPSEDADVKEAQEVAMSYATYRLIRHRYEDSPQAESTMANIYVQMIIQELDTSFHVDRLRDVRSAGIGQLPRGATHRLRDDRRVQRGQRLRQHLLRAA